MAFVREGLIVIYIWYWLVPKKAIDDYHFTAVSKNANGTLRREERKVRQYTISDEPSSLKRHRIAEALRVKPPASGGLGSSVRHRRPGDLLKKKTPFKEPKEFLELVFAS
jgi:hypothetical protein